MESPNPPVVKNQTPLEILELRRFCRFEVQRVLDKYLNMKSGDLASMMEDKEYVASLTMLEYSAARIILRIAARGDMKALNGVLDRLIGKVKPEPDDDPGKGPVSVDTELTIVVEEVD